MSTTAAPDNDTSFTERDEQRYQFETVISEAATLLRQGKYAPELIAGTYEALAQIRASGENAGTAQTMGDLAALYWEQIAQWKNAAPTGLNRLDSILGGGILPGRLMALLGAPGMGKSSLATQIAETVASLGRPVVYLTSEDSPHMLLCRSLARLCDVDYGPLLRGYIGQDTFTRITQTYQQRESSRRLLITEQRGPFSLEALRQRAHQHFASFTDDRSGPGLLVVDYLQRLARSVNGAGNELRHAVAFLTEQLRDVARDLNCCVLVLSAQSRDAYKNGGNGGSALASGKESGDLEYTADALMAIVPVDDKKAAAANPGHELRLLRIDKNRQGQVGTLTLDWYGTRQMFSEVSE